MTAETLVSLLSFTQYFGLLCFAGLLFFDGFVLRGRHRSAPSSSQRLILAFGIACTASYLLIPVSAVRIVGGSIWKVVAPELWIEGVQWPPVIAALLITFAGLTALLCYLRRGGIWFRMLWVTCGAVTVSSPVLVGHSRSHSPLWAMVLSDIAHLVAAAFWLGGVIGLWHFLARGRTLSEGPQLHASSEYAVRVVLRFSRFALISVAVLAVSGTVMAVLILGAWDTLLGSAYGRTLLLKLCVLVAVIVLAVWNRFMLIPIIASRPTEPLRWASLRRTLSYEAALLVVIVAITGFLGNGSPRHHGVHDNMREVQQVVAPS